MRLNNRFYKSFDYQTVGDRRSDPYRTPFQVDRDRILHSYAFRRLQAKTQVFKPGEYDFYRTRLTHTIEVAQIGRSICRFVRNSAHLRSTFCVDENLVEAICLAHDIGHPPFGHAGERVLNRLMSNFGGFEGNAQNLRLLTETIWADPKNGRRVGMKPTRALLDGVLKYKKLRSEATDDAKFIYDEQKKLVDFVHGRSLPTPSALKSIECQIMELADDVAYSIGDVVDGVKARFITIERLRNWDGEALSSSLMDKLITAVENGDIDRFAARKIGQCIESCSLARNTNPVATSPTNRYRFNLKVKPARRRELDCLQAIAIDMVFKSPAVEQLEYKAKSILEQLFHTLGETYIYLSKPKRHLLPKDIEGCLEKAHCERERARILCDQISGMSDEYAVRIHRRLFEPEFGSIADLV
jgi:dGTPase